LSMSKKYIFGKPLSMVKKAINEVGPRSIYLSKIFNAGSCEDRAFLGHRMLPITHRVRDCGF